MDKEKCPKCGTACQPGTLECQSCGVIFQRYRESLKKCFREAFANIAERGLLVAKDELEAVSQKFPSIGQICLNYIYLIEQATKEYEKGNHETAKKLFSRLTDKRPELHNAVSMFINSVQDPKETLRIEQPEEVQEQPPVAEKEEKKNIFNNRLLMRLIATAGIITFVYMVGQTPSNKSYTAPSSSYSSSTSSSSHSSSSSLSQSSGYAEKVVDVLNTAYGNVCHAELEGFFSKTLKIDWTSNTVKLHVIKVLAEIGSVKESLYKDGVRYLEFPNDRGTYNVIDWKTGEKTSTSERAQYYFPE
jgi:hypothetical protein